MVFVATLMAVGSVRAEEPKMLQTHGEMKPGHTSETHKINQGQVHQSEPMKREIFHGQNNARQNHSTVTPKPLPHRPAQNAGTHPQMEHGTPHNAGVHKNVSSMGQPWPKLSGPDQILYKQNMNDIMVLQNGLFGNPHLTGDPGFDAEVYNGTLMRDILQTCDAFCQETNQDRCAFVEGLTYSHGLSIPADRQAFLTCFHQGVAQQPASQGICFDTCTGGVYGSPNTCGDQKIRQGCKLLCCGMRNLILNCLGQNHDSCTGYKP